MKSRFSYTLSIKPYWHDHFFEGQAVFPAVEALVTLAAAVRSLYPRAVLHHMTGARFPRRLILEPAGDQQPVQIEIEAPAADISAALLTSIKIKNNTIGRTLEHARVTFVQDAVLPEQTLSFRRARKLDGACISVPAVSVYRELIPFGLSYQNMVGDLSISESGALADISGGGETDDVLLGSPFVLDAAMHAACVWGQRFADIVSFPVGFDRRIIHNTARTGMSYFARIKPVMTSGGTLIFDAWIFDQDGLLSESISGLRMRDISRGRMRPPQWIKEGV